MIDSCTYSSRIEYAKWGIGARYVCGGRHKNAKISWLAKLPSQRRADTEKKPNMLGFLKELKLIRRLPNEMNINYGSLVGTVKAMNFPSPS